MNVDCVSDRDACEALFIPTRFPVHPSQTHFARAFTFRHMAVRALATANSSPNLYIPSLDGMRAIAFLVVFVAHSMPHRVLPGGFGVAIFFFLSGYLITTLLRAEAERTSQVSLRDFYLRRVLRIFPPCYLTIVIVSVLAATGAIYNTESYKSLIAGFLYFSNYWNIMGWGNLPAGLGILWSLAVEEHYYLLYPLLYAWFARASLRRSRQAAVLLALCGLAMAWRCYRAAVMHSSWENIYEGTDTRFDAILFGCVLAIVANSRLGDRVGWFKKHANALAACGVVVIVATFAYRNQVFRDTVRYTLQQIALMPIFFLITLPQKGLVTRCLEWRWLRHLGHLSYSMYLIHHTLFHHFYHYYRPSVWLACGIFVLTFAYAQAMRTLVELPIQRWRSRVTRSRAVVPIGAPQDRNIRVAG
jgi:peptidoglycan/LPS O-acetylase OafA/YrhL